MYKVAIISCGMIANSAHIPAYKFFNKDFEIVGVCDVNENVACETAKRHDIRKYYTDANRMLDELRPDVVSVCVPNMLHKEYTILALNYGCHVLCEKPLAFTYSDAKEMFDLAKKKNKILMACQSMRFTPDRMAAYDLIKRGELGDVYYADISRVRPRGIPTWGAFHIKKISGGGALIDIGVHMLDAALWLMGNPKPVSVTATTAQNHVGEIGSLKESGALTGEVYNKRPFNPDEMDVEDFACGSICFENGARINFKVAWAANYKEQSDIDLIGRKAGIELPDGIMYKGNEVEQIKCKKNRFETSSFPGHYYIIENLRDVLNGDADLIVKPEETINTAKIIAGIYNSADTGKEVTWED